MIKEVKMYHGVSVELLSTPRTRTYISKKPNEQLVFVKEKGERKGKNLVKCSEFESNYKTRH